jgi:hypothetical protein
MRQHHFCVSLSLILIVINVAAQDRTAVVERSFGNFVSATSLAVNGAGELLVVDGGRNLLCRYSAAGELLKSIGGKGWGALEFDQPTDVCASFPLDIFIADFNNRRLERFDRNMNFVQSLTEDNIASSPQQGFYARASSISPLGELYVVETDGRRVLKFTSQLSLEREFGSYNAGAGTLHAPADLVVGDDGAINVADGGRIVKFDAYGNYVSLFVVDTSVAIGAVSAIRGGLLNTMGDRIVARANDGTSLWELRRSMLVGAEEHESFRDAAVVSSTLYILTERRIMVCRFPAE